jgi:hypothetical protein
MSDSSRAVFDPVCAQGFIPQTVEARDEHGCLIAPNKLGPKLVGAIVCVTCTLERMLFGRKGSGARNWQIYANVVKIQVLEPAPAIKTTPSCGKRKADRDSDNLMGSPEKRRNMSTN